MEHTTLAQQVLPVRTKSGDLMNHIQKQVVSARRRLFFIDLIQTLGVSLFLGLMVAAIGLAIPKIWHMAFLTDAGTAETWNWSWIGGGLLLGLLGAIVATWYRCSNSLDAAIEVDQRFGLKERLSSAMELSDSELETEAGQALIRDANDRAESIELSDQFRFQPSRQLLLPLVPAMLVLGLVFVPDAAAKVVEKAPPTDKVEIKSTFDEAKKKIQKKMEEMKAKGLKDADKNLQSLQKKIDNLSSDLKDDKKDTLVKLNNVKKQIEDRQSQIGGNSKEMKKQLNQLKKINDGPAEKISQAMNEGDFKGAKEAVKDLIQRMKDGKLSEKERKKLAKDLKQIAKDMNEISERHEQKKKELQKQIDKANREGDLQKAAKLQQKLDKQQRQDEQIQKMKKMAQKLQKCANCMKQGNGQPKQGDKQQQPGGEQGNQPSDADMQDALESLEDLEDMMDQMQNEMDELEDLEAIMEEIEAAKNNCNGCEGNKDQPPKWQDWAKGGGRGAGLRDKTETETGSYKSRVKGKIQKGETVVTGHADGANISGRSISEAREIAKSSVSKKSDPLENQKLPKAQREHAREYFESLRK